MHLAYLTSENLIIFCLTNLYISIELYNIPRCHPESCVKVERKQAGRDAREVQPVHLIGQGREMPLVQYPQTNQKKHARPTSPSRAFVYTGKPKRSIGLALDFQKASAEKA